MGLEKNKETYYQRLILEDIKKPRYKMMTKLFPAIILSFLILQVVYYFLYFHHTIWKRIAVISNYHAHDILLVRPKTVMYTYDYLLVFILYLFFVFTFFILAFIAFDSSQRSKIIKRLSEDKNQENEKDA